MQFTELKSWTPPKRDYGFAETKKLPYGVYAVKQTKGAEGTELMPAFDVFVNEDGEIYRYLINNATFEALIEIVKKDAETGKVIPAAGIGFKVRNTDTGEWITQHINYPTPMDIDTFYTDTTGKLMAAISSVTVFAAGDVAGAIENTWTQAQTQIKTVVNNVVFPVIDMILAILFFVKLGTAYFDYRKHGQFEFTAPAILFACLIFTLTAPLYIWTIL